MITKLEQRQTSLAHRRTLTVACSAIECVASELAAAGDSRSALDDLFQVMASLRRRITNEEALRSLAGTPARRAAFALLALMEDISEEYFSANWYTNLEHKLWTMLQPGYRQLNPETGESLSQEEAAQLRALHEACGGWWYHDEKLGGRMFATTAEWLKRPPRKEPSSSLASGA